MARRVHRLVQHADYRNILPVEAIEKAMFTNRQAANPIAKIGSCHAQFGMNAQPVECRVDGKQIGFACNFATRSDAVVEYVVQIAPGLRPDTQCHPARD